MKDMTREGIDTEHSISQAAIRDQPSKLFSNWFVMGNYPLVSSSSYAYVEYDWWYTVWTALSSKFNQTWKYFKCDMEISIQLNSSPLDYGWFGVSWNPSSLTGTPYSVLNSRLHEIDISTGGTHLITIPYSSAYECYDVAPSSSDTQTNRPKFYLIMGRMSTLAQVFSATIDVRARFTNMVAFGVPIIDNNLTALSVEEKRVVKGVLQMSQVNTLVTSVGTVATTALLGYQYMRDGVQKAKEIHEFVGEGKKVGEMLEEDYSWLTGGDKKQSYIDRNVKSSTRRDRIEKEAKNNQTHNAPTFYDSMTSIGYIPENENLSFSMHHLPPDHLWDKAPKNLLQIAQVPCMVQNLDYVAGSANVLRCSPFAGLTGAGYSAGVVDYMAQVSDLFRFWRGCIDFEFTIHTSPLISANFVFECGQYGDTDPNTSLATWSPNFAYIRHETVTGFGTIKIRVPFIFNKQWCAFQPKFGTATSFQYPEIPSLLRITCKTISSGMAGSGAIPHVYVTVKKSAGPDFQLRNLNGCYMNTRGVAAELQMMEVQNKDQDGWINICGGESSPSRYRYTPEDDFDVVTLSQRWSITEFSGTDSFNPLTNARSSLAYQEPIDLFLRIQQWFRYVRGNIQYKVRIKDAYATEPFVQFGMESDFAFRSVVANPYNEQVTSGGAAFCVPSLNPMLTFEAPLEGDTEWLLTYDSWAPAVNDYTYSLNGQAYVPSTFDWDNSLVYLRAGRGYDLAFLQPPMGSYNLLLKTWLAP